MSYDILFIDITELNAYISINLNKPMEKRMTKHFITSDGIKIDGFENATDFNKALKEWEKKQAELNNNNEEEKNNEK